MGVAAVVGTLLALLVFLAIFGVFLTQYLPLWMSENEQSFAVTVAGQFGQIDHSLSAQYISGNTQYAASNPVTMTSNYIPVFSQPTYGTLTFGGSEPFPDSLYESVTFHQYASTGWTDTNYSTGALMMALHDRYYSPITYSLEQGAVISEQNGTAQSLIFSPSVIANSSGSASTLDLTMFSTYGNTTSQTSTGTEQVYTQFVTSQSYSGLTGGTPVYVNFTTYFPCAWSTYWNNTFTSLNNSGYPTSSIAPGLQLNPLPYHTTAALTKSKNVAACHPIASTTPVLVRLYFPLVLYFNLAVAIFNVAVGTTTAP